MAKLSAGIRCGLTKTTSQAIAGTRSRQLPIFDRSRSRLRIPIDILPEALRQANGEGLASPVATVKLETGGVMANGDLHPSAAQLLQVIASASMMVAVDVQYDGDSSVTTIWATPSRAVVTSTLDAELVDIEPVRVARLPETLSDVILLSRPEVTADHQIVASTLVVANAERFADQPERARRALEAGGICPDDIERLLAFQSPTSRRWRISSTWATDGGQQMAELRGIDAGLHGQWLMEMRGDHTRDSELVFTPQDDGAILRALRGFFRGIGLGPH